MELAVLLQLFDVGIRSKRAIEKVTLKNFIDNFIGFIGEISSLILGKLFL